MSNSKQSAISQNMKDPSTKNEQESESFGVLTEKFGDLSMNKKSELNKVDNLGEDLGEDLQTPSISNEKKEEAKTEGNDQVIGVFEEFKGAETTQNENVQFQIDDVSLMAKELQERRGVSLFGDLEEKERLKESLANGRILVLIISAIPDTSEHEKRWEVLVETIQQYRGNTSKGILFEVVVICPEHSRELYKNKYTCSTIGYKIQECEAARRKLNVGDARNAALLCGLLVGADYFILSDDDRNSVFRYDETTAVKIGESPDALIKFHETIKQRMAEFALLGIASQRNWRNQTYPNRPDNLISAEKVRVAQLIAVNLKTLKKYNVSYLPVRMGEDNTFCYDVSKLSGHNGEEIEVSEILDFRHTDPNLLSIARTEENGNIESYSRHDYPYLQSMFGKILVPGTGTVNPYRLYWTCHGYKNVSIASGSWRLLIKLREELFMAT